MKRAAILFLLLVPLIVFGQTVSYWFQGWQRKPDAKQAQEYFMVPGANVAFTYATNHVIINAVGGGGLFQLTGDVLGGAGVPVPTTLAVIGAGGVNTKITFDTKGRVTGSAAAQLASADFVNQGSTTTLLHGNAAGNPSWAKVDLANEVSGSLANASLANSSVTYNGTTVALGASGTLTLASANFQNQGTTTTVLHGNAVGNPSWSAVNLATDVTGTLPGVWLTGGNTLGAGTFFLGSIDNRQLQFRVNNVQVGLFSTLPSTSLGQGANASAASSTAVGSSAVASDVGATAVGLGSTASKPGATALGQSAQAAGSGSVAIGNVASASGDDSFASGNGSVASAQGSVALGFGANAIGNFAYALGAAAVANNDGSFVYNDLTHAGGYSDSVIDQFVVSAGGGIDLNSWGAGVTADGPVYSGNTINSTNSGSVIPYTYYAEQNVGLVAAGQMPMGCWGCISAFGAATRVNLGNAVTQNTYYPITNYNHVVTNHWVANTWTTTNGILMNVFAGYYRITFAFSGRGGTGDQLEVDVATNNVVTDVIAAHGSSGAGAGKDISMSGTGILYLPAATKVGLRVQDTSASAAITVSHAAITVGTP